MEPVQSAFTVYVPSTVTGVMLPFALVVAVALVLPSPVESLPANLAERARIRGWNIGIE